MAVKPFSYTIVMCLLLTGCVKQVELTPAQLAKLKGGTTTIVAYFECPPISHLTGSKLWSAFFRIIINGKVAAKVDFCGHTTFKFDSGQHQMSIGEPKGLFALDGYARPVIFHPGTTQYLSIYRDGYSNVFHRWTTKSVADKQIEALKKIKSIF